MVSFFFFFFFFSSRRRHTRSLCDWSSDVCSSDLCVQDRMRTMVVVKLAHMPEGRKAPPNAMPRGLPPERVLAEVVEKIAAMDAIITEAESKFGSELRLLDHPILGPLQAKEWRKFHWVHGRHHLKQIQRLRSKPVKSQAASFEL